MNHGDGDVEIGESAELFEEGFGEVLVDRLQEGRDRLLELVRRITD